MATQNFTLTDAWIEVADEQVSIVLVSGKAFWAFNGPTVPSGPDRLANYIPLTREGGEAAYSYGGTEKTFCRIAGTDTGVVPGEGLRANTTVSVTEIK